MLAYLNGEYLPRHEVRISPDDRGFLFGDGIYEVVRALDGSFFEAEPHLLRMEEGLRGIRIEPGDALKRETILPVMERLLRESGLEEGHATVYIQVTRGAAARTHGFPPAETRPTVFLSVSRFQPQLELQQRGASAILHPDMRWARCNLKTVNLLPNVLAKQAAVEVGAFEAVLVRDGFVTEGASTNVVGVKGGTLVSYPNSNYILPGITRAVIVRLAEENGIPFEDAPILAAAAHELDELFVIGTTTDVMPVVRLDGRPIADGRPGPVTRKLGAALARCIAAGGA